MCLLGRGYAEAINDPEGNEDLETKKSWLLGQEIPTCVSSCTTNIMCCIQPHFLLCFLGKRNTGVIKNALEDCEDLLMSTKNKCSIVALSLVNPYNKKTLLRPHPWWINSHDFCHWRQAHSSTHITSIRPEKWFSMKLFFSSICSLLWEWCDEFLVVLGILEEEGSICHSQLNCDLGSTTGHDYSWLTCSYS